jgi:hypothetical protein
MSFSDLLSKPYPLIPFKSKFNLSKQAQYCTGYDDALFQQATIEAEFPVSSDQLCKTRTLHTAEKLKQILLPSTSTKQWPPLASPRSSCEPYTCNILLILEIFFGTV